jgi:phosphate transport system permease protein
LGETAPLLLIGMVAFVREFPAAPPEGLFDAATALPVQVYSWTQRSDPGLRRTGLGRDHRAAGLPDLHERHRRAPARRFERRW